MSPRGSDSSIAHVPELDGLRGIAILLVLLFHSAQHVFAFGWMGVDLFFVLSGFLISAGLLRSVGRPHFFRDFYVKRALRIWPIYLLLLAVAFIALPALLGIDEPSGSISYLLYFQNFVHPLNTPEGLGQLWSLAVEEHFYLLWPVIVFVLSRRGVERCALALIAVAPLARLLLIATGAPAWTIYYLTPCRVDALALGAWLAVYAAKEESPRHQLRRWSGPIALSCAAVAVPLAFWFGGDVMNGTVPALYPNLRAGVLTLTAFAGAGCVGYAIASGSDRVSRLLRNRLLGYFGKISYGMYMYHALIFAAVSRQIESGSSKTESLRTQCLRALLEIGATVLVASVSWYALERPILRCKSLLRPGALRAGSTLVPAPVAPTPLGDA